MWVHDSLKPCPHYDDILLIPYFTFGHLGTGTCLVEASTSEDTRRVREVPGIAKFPCGLRPLLYRFSRFTWWPCNALGTRLLLLPNGEISGSTKYLVYIVGTDTLWGSAYQKTKRRNMASSTFQWLKHPCGERQGGLVTLPFLFPRIAIFCCCCCYWDMLPFELACQIPASSRLLGPTIDALSRGYQ